MLLRSVCRALVVMLLFCASGRAVLAQAEPGSRAFRITVKVSADTELKPVVEKALQDALRGLPDVQVTDDVSDYTISVIALKVVNRSRRDVGATFSVLVTEPYKELVRQFAESHVAPEHREALAAMLSGAVKPLAHWVETASATDIPQVCRSIVQSFEKDVLRERRNAAGAHRGHLNSHLSRETRGARP